MRLRSIQTQKAGRRNRDAGHTRLRLNDANTHDEPDVQSLAFYTALFHHAPTKVRDGYAKWQLEDPRVNFVLEKAHSGVDQPGVHHVGIEAEDEGELNMLRARLTASELPMLDVGETVCCFSRSDKAWTVDPNGVRWEAFRSFGDVDNYGARTESEQSSLCGKG